MSARSGLLLGFPEVFFGMSGRRGGVSPEPYGLNMSYRTGDSPDNVRRNRELFFERFKGKAREWAFPTQIHGDAIRRVQKGGTYPDCDGLLTNVPGCAIAVTVADCLPVMLYDPPTRSVGIVHSGWRGCRLEIVKKGVRMMRSEFGARSGTIVAFVGPGASSCCYEVGEEILSGFDTKYVIQEGGPRNGKPRLDLKLHTQDLLREEGLPEENIELSPVCTICSPDEYHSYRREGQRSGRMMAVLGLV